MKLVARYLVLRLLPSATTGAACVFDKRNSLHASLRLDLFGMPFVGPLDGVDLQKVAWEIFKAF